MGLSLYLLRIETPQGPSCGRSKGVHNTNSPLITVHYPFHPYAGQRLRCYKVSGGPPESYATVAGDRRLSIPAWMVEVSASKFRLSDSHQIDVDRLQEIAKVVQVALASLTHPSFILSEKPKPRKEFAEEIEAAQLTLEAAQYQADRQELNSDLVQGLVKVLKATGRLPKGDNRKDQLALFDDQN